MKGNDSQRRESVAGWAGFVVGPAFLLLALWLVAGPNLAEVPKTSPVSIHPDALTTAPRRAVLTDPPTIFLDGYQRTCNDCHRIFPAQEDPPARLFRHTHIHLEHGINDRCRNCHDVEDRNRLVLHSGETLPFGDVVNLCAKCHGPIYRDWQRGMHGRANGYWDAKYGDRRLLGCTECHDPHNPRVPAMDPLRPLPPPNTLRMARHEEPVTVDHEERDPLRRALRASGGTGTTPSPTSGASH